LFERTQGSGIAENLVTGETLLLLLAIVAAFTPLVVSRRLLRGWTWVICLLAVAVVATGASLWHASTAKNLAREKFRMENVPRPRTDDEYVASDKCRSCHPSEYASWHRTYHRTMTQLATPESVVGNFEGVRMASTDGNIYLERRGDEFWAARTFPGWNEKPSRKNPPPGKLLGEPVPPDAWRQIVMTTGSHHMQIYWATGKHPNHLYILPLTYLIPEQRWVPLRDIFLKDPHKLEFYGFTYEYSSWNFTCIQCHSTAGQPRPLSKTGHMDTTVGELGIACEACHGPGAEHVRVHGDPLRRYAHHLGDRADPTIVNPANEPAPRSAQICGHCHGINGFSDGEDYDQNGPRYRPGGDLQKTRPAFRPMHSSCALMMQSMSKDDPFLTNRFWSDGMVRVSGREYSSLIESTCYQGGDLSCLSCHSMHQSDPDDQLAQGMEGDKACLQCHASLGEEIEKHTHHPAASGGSRCYNCHMPHTAYGLLKAQRSHEIDSPSVSSSVETGRPNACNLCHLDRSLGWAQEHLEKWYDVPAVQLTAEQKEISAVLLWLLRGDAGQRALAAWTLGWGPAREAAGEEWLPPFLAHLLDDPYPAVRFIAGRSLQSLAGLGISYDYIAPREERILTQQEVLAAWKRRRASSPGRTGPNILIKDDGTLNRATIESLSSQRDDRSMDLAE
jgi:predicted CXXCH cytochrome family protein